MKSAITSLICLLCLFFLFSCDQKKDDHLLSEKKEMVSVICPTYGRENYHANLYTAFKNQNYENKELLVLDDSPSPSPFFTTLQDPTVTYKHSPTRISIGEKRNILIRMSKGSIIAQFDDDDYYSPVYLDTMIQSLGNADFIKLSKWMIWRRFDGSLWEWDTRFFDKHHYIITGDNADAPLADASIVPSSELAAYIDQNTWGFGFSYVYKKSLWEECPYDDINAGEDYEFVLKAQKLNKVLVHIPDTNHMILHTVHRNNVTAKIYPQYHYETSQATELFGEGVSPWLITDN